MTKENITFVAVILFIIGLITFLFIVSDPITNMERVECEKLKIQSERYNEFYLTDWQAEMCSHAEVIINAPVKTQQ